MGDTTIKSTRRQRKGRSVWLTVWAQAHNRAPRKQDSLKSASAQIKIKSKVRRELKCPQADEFGERMCGSMSHRGHKSEIAKTGKLPSLSQNFMRLTCPVHY